jgi:hypothetical protein
MKKLATSFAMRQFKKPEEDDLELIARERDVQDELTEKISTMKQEGKAIFRTEDMKIAEPSEFNFYSTKPLPSKKRLITLVIAKLDHEIDETPSFDKFLHVDLPDYNLTK